MDADLDFNLIVALDALLRTESVTEAAEAMRTSAPAMSRTLARLRRTFDDPLLVRAGRGLVPTPRALALREEVAAVVSGARGLLRAPADADPAAFARTFTLQGGGVLDGPVAATLLARVRERAPGVRLRFRSEDREGGPALRDGSVDLEIGQLDIAHPEIRTAPLGTHRLVGVARAGHPLLRGRVTPRRFAAAEHVVVSRRGRLSGPIDERLAELGLRRTVVAALPAYSAMLLLIAQCDVVGTAAAPGAGFAATAGLATFTVPVELPDVPVGMAWHPRHDADPEHRWLRGLVREVIAP